MTKRTCSIEGCEDPHEARGWCAKHYQRWKKYGDPLLEVKLPFPENLLARMEPQPDGCIYFRGCIRAKDGYSKISVRGRDEPAHRASYEHFVGPIPEGMTVGHKCHDRSGCSRTDASCLHRRCVNPEHLALETMRDNINASANSKASRTHCPQGHPYDEVNTYVDPGGGRRCRTCRAASR